MAENAGHLIVVESSTDAAAYTEIDGAVSLSIARDRDLLDVTGTKDASGHKVRHGGLKDGQTQIDGHLAFASGTLQVDTGQKNLIQRMRDGGLVALRRKLDGAGGSYVTLASALITDLTISADAGGAVKWSATIQNNGAGWA